MNTEREKGYYRVKFSNIPCIGYFNIDFDFCWHILFPDGEMGIYNNGHESITDITPISPSPVDAKYGDWLSPIEQERQDELNKLKELYSDFPDGAFLWQYMNGLLNWAKIGLSSSKQVTDEEINQYVKENGLTKKEEQK